MRLREVLQHLKLRFRGVWLHWDRYPKDGTRDHPFCGIIEVRGWALALDGVRSVEIFCDGTRLGTAAIGLRRRDVFETFPRIRSSRRSGFHYVLDTARIENGPHELTILGKTIRGRTAQFSAPIFVKNLATRRDRYRRQTAPNAAALAWMRRNQRHLPYRPCITFAMRPIPESALGDLAATIHSLTGQVYDDWQLQIAVNSEMDEKSRARLLQLAAADDRIKFDDLPTESERFGLLEPGDQLSPEALFEMVYFFNRNPDCRSYRLTSPPESVICRARRVSEGGLFPRLRVGLSDYKEGGLSPRLRVGLCDCKEQEQPVVVTHAPCPLIDLEPIRSILVVKLDHLGDVLLTIPAMRRLRELCPEARITALVGSWARPLVEAEPCIDEVLTYDYFAPSSARTCRRLNDADYRQIAELFAGRRFDLAVDLRRESDTREFLWHSGASITAGYANRGEHDWLTIAIAWDDVNAVQPPRRHVAFDALRLVEMIAMSARADTISDYRLVGAHDETTEGLLADMLPGEPGLLVGLHPGAGRAIKCWPAERFAQVADRLIDELGATVVLFGTEADSRQVAGFMDKVRRTDRLVSLVNKLSLPQFIAIVRQFDFFMGNDSGPTHMAAASGIPTLGVYAATVDASLWAPLGPQAAVIQKKMQCSPCYLAKKSDCPYGITCLMDISVDEVWEAAIRVLLPKWEKIPRLAAALEAAP
jgi:ADP-heptose:LPS heptosyltransferase